MRILIFRHCEEDKGRRGNPWSGLDCFVALLLAMTIMAFPAFAQVPAQHPSKQIEAERAQAEKRKAELEKTAKEQNKEMERTKDDLVSIAKEIKKNEARLFGLEKRMSEHRTEQSEIEKRLKKDRHSIGNLVLALERLDRTPPEAIIARPGAPLETAQSAMLLQGILPDIYKRAESLKKDVARLDQILTELAQDEAKVRKEAAELSGRQDEVAVLLKKRQALYAETRGGIQQEDKALREISARAASLKELVARLDERRREQEEAERTRAAQAAKAPVFDAEEQSVARISAARPVRMTPIPKPGASQLPVSGRILVSYKQLDDIGAESQGLTLEGRPAALVVAPMGGVVRYTGTFKSYGRIIIVEHQKDYHSLIAGLDRVDTVVGQSVAAGEPVGTLAKKSAEGGNPTLYYELRLKGEPVNPARKFAGL